MVVLAVLVVGCGDGGGNWTTEDDLLSRAIAAVTPPEQVFHVEGREFPSGGEASARSVAVWIDGDRDLFRYERRREWPGGSERYVKVGEGWEWTDFEESANDIDEGSAQAEYQAKLRDPASLALTYLWILATADEWQVLETRIEQERKLVVLESRTVQTGDGGDIAAGTEFITTIVLEEDTLWPVRQETKTVLPNGEEAEESHIVEFDRVELLARDELPAEFFSRSAVRELFETSDDKIQKAASLDFTLYWLGESDSESGLELTDVFVTSDLVRVVLDYNTESGPQGSVMIWQEKGDRLSRSNCDSSTADTEEVAVRGGKATLETSRYGGHCLTFGLDGTAVGIFTVPVGVDGNDKNPFNNREAIVALAEGLEPAE